MDPEHKCLYDGASVIKLRSEADLEAQIFDVTADLKSSARLPSLRETTRHHRLLVTHRRFSTLRFNAPARRGGELLSTGRANAGERDSHTNIAEAESP